MKFWKRYIMAVCTGLVFLFVYTSIDKLVHIEKNTFIMAQMPLLKGYQNIVAIVVPVAEIIVAILLIIPSTQKFGLYCSFVLMFLFTIYLAIVLIQGGDMPCSCGGVVAKMSWTEHLAFNTGVMALTALALIKWKRV